MAAATSGMSSIQGARVRDARYGEFAVLLAVAVGLALLAYQYREPLQRWMRRQQQKPEPPRGPEVR
mgnify:CR=1 FL=1